MQEDSTAQNLDLHYGRVDVGVEQWPRREAAPRAYRERSVDWELLNLGLLDFVNISF